MSATGPTTEFVDVHQGEQLPINQYLNDEDVAHCHDIFSKYGFNDPAVHKPTKASVEALRRVWYNGWVTICGCSGEGKSYIVRHLVRKLRCEPQKQTTDASTCQKVIDRKNGIAEEGRKKYEFIPISSPNEWREKMKPDAFQLFVIDDIFGTGCLTTENLENWRPLLDEMVVQSSLSNHKLKVIVVFNRVQQQEMPSEYQRYPIFQPQYVLDLHNYRYSYDKAEKKVILNMCSSNDSLSESYMQTIHSSFPMIVRMYSENNSLALHGYEYFRNPWRYVEEILEKVYEFDKIMYYTLAFCILMDGRVNLNKWEFTDYDSNTQYILNQLRQVIPVPSNIDMAMIRCAAKVLKGFFLRQNAKNLDETIFSHDRIYNVAASSVFRKDSKKFVQLCSLNIICERVRTQNYIDCDGVSLNLYTKDYEALVQRYTYEILSGHAKRIATLPCCHDNTLIPAWSTFMEDMGSTEDVLRQQDDDGRPFLFWIVHHGCHMLLKFFLETESLEEVRQEEWFKECLQQGFQGAAYSRFADSPEAVKLLLDYGIKPDQTYPYQEDDIFEVFGFDMGYLIKMQATPIHFAAQNAQPDTVKFLVAAGADKDSPAKDGLTPLHRSALQKFAHTTQALVELKADVNVKSPRGMTPLIEACLHGNREIVDILLKAGADTSVVSPTFGSVLYCGAAGRSAYVPRSLLEADVPKLTNTDTWSALHQVVINQDMQMFHIISNFKVSLECKGKSDWTPLHLAVVYKSEEMVGILLNKKANVEALTSDGKTPLHLAAELGYLDMCTLLLNNGASPDAKTSGGLYPLNLAAKNNHLMVVFLLLEEGLDLELPSDFQELFKGHSQLPPGMQGRPDLMRMMPPDLMDPHMMMMMMHDMS